MNRWLWVVCLAVGLVGCPPDNNTMTGPVRPCVPGAVRSCPCHVAVNAVQTCFSDGSGYGACTGCPPVQDAGVIVQDRGPTITSCSPSNPSGSCSGGGTCINGACCGVDQACGAVCCNAGSVCISDRAGNRACATTCGGNAECPASAPCCRALADQASGAPLGYGACGVFVAGETACRCSTPSECGGGGCTPYVNTAGVPQRPMICTADGCGPYQHCTGFGSCPNGYCNMCDSVGNCYCAQVCTSSAMCGGVTCGRLARSNGSCAATQTVCFP